MEVTMTELVLADGPSHTGGVMIDGDLYIRGRRVTVTSPDLTTRSVVMDALMALANGMHIDKYEFFIRETE